MLTRVNLTPEQIATLHDALDREGDGRLDMEMATNIVITVDNFLAVRYLPLPRIPAHCTLVGEERDYDVALFRSEDGYVVLQQAFRDNDQQIREPHTIEANIVIGSQLDFMSESRTEDWPLRVRRMMLDVVQWQLEQGRTMGSADKAPFRLWRELDDPQSTSEFFGGNLRGVQRVLAGQGTTRDLWGQWAQDEAHATREFSDCRAAGQVIRQLVQRAAVRGP